MGRAEDIELVEWMVRQSSVSRREQSFALALRERLELYGWDARVDEVGNVVARIGDGPCVVGFLGHIDTVPGEIAVRWEGNRLYGRGSVDAKGPLAAFVAAASGMERSECVGKTFIVYGCVEEETSTSKGANWIAQGEPPTYLINGEPSHWDGVTLGYKGLARFELECRNPRAHSAARDYRAPAEALVDSWIRLREHCDDWNHRNSVFEACLPSLRRFDTDALVDEEVARAVINVRVGPECSPDDLEQLLLVPGVSVRRTKCLTAVRTETRSPLARAFARAIREQGGTPTMKTKTGTSDWNTVAPHWRVPTVAYGPGDSALDHTSNEHLDLDDYIRSICVLRRVLTALS